MLKGTGKWHFPDTELESRGCREVSNYICEKMKDGIQRPLPSQPPPNDTPCEEEYGWYGWPGSEKCYKFDFENVTDWSGANKRCADYYSRLVSLHDHNTEAELTKLIKSKQDTYQKFWIGLSDQGGVLNFNY